MCTGARTAPYHLLDQTINRRQMCGDIHRSPHMWSMRTMTYCTTSSLLCKQLQTIMQLITSFCSLLITQFLSSWSCSDLRLTAAHTLPSHASSCHSCSCWQPRQDTERMEKPAGRVTGVRLQQEIFLFTIYIFTKLVNNLGSLAELKTQCFTRWELLSLANHEFRIVMVIPFRTLVFFVFLFISLND